MAGIATRVCSSMALLAVLSTAGQGAYADTQGGRLVPWRIERDIQRFKAVATDNVMKLLAIRPGMTILDIGAGSGQFAYEFARRLDGTGRVFATDTNGDCIDYMKNEADRRNLGNLHPVLVKKDGLDPFYGKQRYDLITVFHVSMPYGKRFAYFRELRGFLAEGGRIILILYKIPAPFSPGDFTGDFTGLLRELSSESPESPYYGMLKDSTRKRIRDHRKHDPPEALKRAIVEDFNETLTDTRFAARFFTGSIFRNEAKFTPEEQSYADWYLLPYTDIGDRNKEIRPQRTSGVPEYSTINKLLVLQKFRGYLKKDGLFLSGFTPSIRTVFEKAGYRLEREVADLIPFEDMIVLSTP